MSIIKLKKEIKRKRPILNLDDVDKTLKIKEKIIKNES